MTVIESLPARPLKTVEIEEMNEERVCISPKSGMPMQDLIFAVMYNTEQWLYGLGFDEERSGWVVIEKVSIDDPEASKRVDIAVNEWVDVKYGGKYGNIEVGV